MRDAPSCKALLGVAIRFWSLVAANDGRIPGVTIKKSSPQASRMSLASSGEATTPSTPASLASFANVTTWSEIGKEPPIADQFSSSKLVKAVIANSLGRSMPSSAACCCLRRVFPPILNLV